MPIFLPSAQTIDRDRCRPSGLTAGAEIDMLAQMEVVVLADTHLSKGFDGIDPQVLSAIAQADVVLHAGDITSRRALAELESMAQTYAVLGNNDRDLVGVLPESRLLDLDGVCVALVHDSGPRGGRETRLCKRFPTADVVVFGHSHIPIDDAGAAHQLLFNPGSPTQRRSQPHRTFGRLRLSSGRIDLHQVEVIT
jgi:putative phosphoesterase